jgi:hypothetical protein
MTILLFSSSTLILFLASGLRVASQCQTDLDCSLNGVCDSLIKTYVCDSDWKASDCSALNLQPATRNTGYNKTAGGTSSWGSKIIHDPEEPKLFHLFLAEFGDGCGLDYWSPYSRIIRVDSEVGPQGPYEFVEEVIGTFAHNPTVIYSSADKLYLFYYIGCDFSPPEICTAPSFSCGPRNDLNAESGISVASSPDLKTWTFVGQIFSGQNDDDWDADVTNPSPFPLYSSGNHTASILLAYRDCLYNCNGAELLNLATAPGLKGPYTKISPNPILENGNEDPFLWRDKRGNYHMLLHSLEPEGGFGDGPKVGRYAYAKEFEGPWIVNNKTLAFDTHVEYTDGTSIDFYRRERPQLFFSEDGEMTPLFLTNGVQEVGSGMSYRIIQPLGGADEYEKHLEL